MQPINSPLSVRQTVSGTVPLCTRSSGPGVKRSWSRKTNCRPGESKMLLLKNSRLPSGSSTKSVSETLCPLKIGSGFDQVFP